MNNKKEAPVGYRCLFCFERKGSRSIRSSPAMRTKRIPICRPAWPARSTRKLTCAPAASAYFAARRGRKQRILILVVDSVSCSGELNDGYRNGRRVGRLLQHQSLHFLYNFGRKVFLTASGAYLCRYMLKNEMRGAVMTIDGDEFLRSIQEGIAVFARIQLRFLSLRRHTR